MKTIKLISGLVICLFLAQCKKDNSSTNISIPRTGLELLASSSAQQYMVSVVSSRDTFIMQDVDGQLPVITDIQERMGQHWLTGPKLTLTKSNNSFGLLFYRLDNYVANHPVPVNCSLISDILNQDSLKIGDVSKYPYGMQVFYQNPLHTTDSYEWYALKSSYGMMNIIEKTPISTDTSGCTTYKVRGSVSCDVTDPPQTCGVYIINLNFCLKVTQ